MRTRTDLQIPVFSAAEMAVNLRDCRLIAAELMYKPRPSAERERRVFDFTLAARLVELSRYDGAAVVWIADSAETIASLNYLQAEYPRLRFV
ncbi:MAG TPA: hypothetical protein VHO69_06530, partial [Phototrophicaceae bacterium]|nr:hypothetical protein [Phototrophicaceae bacterium]